MTARDRGRARPHFLVSGRILAFLHLKLGRPTLRIGVEGDIAGAGAPIEKSREITLKLHYQKLKKDPQSALYRKQGRLRPLLKYVNYPRNLRGHSWTLTTDVFYWLIARTQCGSMWLYVGTVDHARYENDE